VTVFAIKTLRESKRADNNDYRGSIKMLSSAPGHVSHLIGNICLEAALIGWLEHFCGIDDGIHPVNSKGPKTLT